MERKEKGYYSLLIMFHESSCTIPDLQAENYVQLRKTGRKRRRKTIISSQTLQIIDHMSTPSAKNLQNIKQVNLKN